MDRSYDHLPEDDGCDLPPRQTEESIRAMLDQSRRDIDAGRTVPLQPVLDRMDAAIQRIRARRAAGELG